MARPAQTWPIPPLTMALFWGLLLTIGRGIDATSAPLGEVAPTVIPVRQIVLFSSGVGYFEHMGVIPDGGSAELRFKANQINDLLKSLVVQNLSGGQVGTVVYPSQDPLSKTLPSFQVDLSANPSLADILTQARGAIVQVMAHGEQLSGMILGVEKKQRIIETRDQLIETSALNLISGGSIRSIPLDEIQHIELADVQLQEELHKALSALAQARDRANKPVSIAFEGAGEQRVRVGYVIETPIWKTSYRLLLPSTPDELGKIQGWAIVENQTDHDWLDVQLTLVSGRPISFVQDLYAPLYLPRPVIRPELYGGLRPPVYESGVEPPAVQEAAPAAPAPPPPPPRARALAGTTRGKPSEAAPGASEAADQEPPLDPTASVVAAAAAGPLGELFQYAISHVSLPRQRSAMLPIITDDIAVERLSIYNQAVLPRHPLNGVRLKNNTGKHLQQGPVTVLDDHGYGGDARVDNLPPSQERLLSYAIDLQMNINATKPQQDSQIQTASLVKGVLHLTRKNVSTQEYVVENRAERDKVLIIEHPLRQGWKLADGPNPIEMTDKLYRFKASVASAKTMTMTIKEEMVLGETIAVLPSNIGQLEMYSRMGEIPGNVRDALSKAISLKKVLVDTERQIQERQQQLREIAEEQKRIRENMTTVSATSQYYTRLLTKLNEQETLIEKIHADLEELKKAYEYQRQELENYLFNTTL